MGWSGLQLRVQEARTAEQVWKDIQEANLWRSSTGEPRTVYFGSSSGTGGGSETNNSITPRIREDMPLDQLFFEGYSPDSFYPSGNNRGQGFNDQESGERIGSFAVSQRATNGHMGVYQQQLRRSNEGYTGMAALAPGFGHMDRQFGGQMAIAPNFTVPVNNSPPLRAPLAPAQFKFGLSHLARNTGGRERVGKAAQLKQARMIKNRESAARSRIRKQGYTGQLEALAVELREENERLSEGNKKLSRMCAFILENSHASMNLDEPLRRTQSNKW